MAWIQSAQCDCCNKISKVFPEAEASKRKIMSEIGWYYHGGVQLCPECDTPENRRRFAKRRENLRG